MRLSAIFILATGAVAQFAGQSRNSPLDPFVNVRKRQLLSCEETYGQGSINCGASTFCFNPALGQSCCLVDFGYCEKGSYCAPVAGYCCMEGESLQDCAKIAGFDLPKTVTQSLTATLTLPRSSSSVAVTISPAPAISTASSTVSMSAPYPTGAGTPGPAQSTGVAPTRATGRPIVTAGAAVSRPSSLFAGVLIGSVAGVVVFL